MNKLFPLTLLCCILLASCRSLDSQSGLYDVKLEHSYKAAVDGGWLWGKGNPFPGQKKGRIYIAPLDISLVEAKEPERAPLLVPQMYEYVSSSLSAALQESNKANGMDWQVTNKPDGADIRIDAALVRFRPQRPGLEILSTIGGHFIKVPGVSNAVEYFAKGDICIEATVRNNHTGELMMAFKDSNRKKAKLYTAEAYSRNGNADVNMKAWAHKLARLFRECAPDKSGDKTLRERLGERGLIDVAKARLAD